MINGCASYCQRDGVACTGAITFFIVTEIAGFARSTSDYIVGCAVASKGVASVVDNTLVGGCGADAFITQALTMSTNVVECASVAIVTNSSFVDGSTHKDVSGGGVERVGMTTVGQASGGAG